MRNLSILLTLLALAIGSHAQKIIYRKGNVVYKEGRSVPGYIGAGNWLYTPLIVWFARDSTGDDAQEVGPGEIREFRFENGEHYASGLITWDNTAALTGPGCCCAPGYVPMYSEVFLRALVGGPVLDLYKFEDKKGVRFVVKKAGSNGDSAFVTLGETIESKSSEGSVRYWNVFKLQLVKFIDTKRADSIEINNDVQKSAYTEMSMVWLVSLMNGNNANGYIYKEEIHRRNNLFVWLGAASATLRFQGNNQYLSDLSFETSTVPYYKIGYEFNNAWKHPSITTRLAVAFWGVKYEGIGTGSEYTLRQFTVEPSVSVLKTIIYPGKSSEIFLGGEGGLNFSSYKGNNLVSHGAGYVQNDPGIIDLQPSWFNFNAMAGLFLNGRQWEIAAFYQFAEVFAWDYGYELNPRMFGLSVGFHFVKRK